jgi:sulfoxide reductase heme-binding subunit YedZ
VTAGLHKNVSLLVVVFLAVHVATAVIDPFAPIRWLDAILPFGSAYRPLWLGFGAIGCDLLIALIATSLLRVRMGYARWRAVHWLAYACWPVAVVHGLGTGSDTRHPWALGIEAACLVLVAGATWWRIGASVTVPAGRRILAASGVALAMIGTAAWTFSGPLQPAWARRAGTPKRLLASARSSATIPSGSGAAAIPSMATGRAAALSVPFSAQVDGTVGESARDASGQAIVVIDARLSGAVTGRVHVVLQGQAFADGGVEMARSRAYLGTVAVPGLYAGSVTELRGPNLVARLTDATGRHVELSLELTITPTSDPTTSHVTGRASARAVGADN